MKIVKEVKMVEEEKILLVLAPCAAPHAPQKGIPPHEGGALLHGGQSSITPQ